MGKRYIQLLNWEKYQARTDKELPWCKLWGSLFDKPWWQDLPDSAKCIPPIFLDVARKFNNRMPSDIAWYRRNYSLNMTEGSFLKICISLQDNGFLSYEPSDESDAASDKLSDEVSDIQDKIRVDKIRVDKSESAKSPSDDVLKNPKETQLYELYQSLIRSGARSDAIRSLKRLLQNGESFESLKTCIENYAEIVSRDKVECKYRIQANNFFGREERFKDFRERQLADWQKEVLAKRGVQC